MYSIEVKVAAVPKLGGNMEKHSGDKHDSDEIWVTDFTQESSLEFREKVLAKAKLSPTEPIVIRINSYGGFVDALALMLSTMDEVPNRFVTVAQGCAISCGAILLSHGDLRFCDRFSRVMIHNISTGSWGDAYALKSDSDEALRLNRRFIGLLAQNCGTTYDKIQHSIKDAVGSKEIWLNAEDALKFGIVDKVGVPHMSGEISWSFQVPQPKVRLNRKKNTEQKKTRVIKKPKKRINNGTKK